MGHTLGLRHNFKGSTIHALDELHDRRITDKEGISSSVMDYNPVNIAPEGQEQGEYYQTTLGPYDYWAIEYAYRPVEADSPASERAQLDKIAGQVAEKDLAYGTDEDAIYWTRGIDPSAARWDLRDDPIAHYRDQIALSKELWAKVEDKFEQKGERYQTLRRVFGWGFRPYFFGGGQCQPLYRRYLSLPRPCGRWTPPTTAGAARPAARGARLSGGARVRARRLSLVAGVAQQAGTGALGRFHLVGVRRAAD